MPKNKNNNFHSFNNYEKYVKDMHIYNDEYMRDYYYSKNIDTIMVKAGMGMGKTKKLHNLFNNFEDKKIVIVSFRRTLDNEYYKNFTGFELYQNITTNTYDTDIYNKLVVQIDSFYKIRGEIDLLVLDEFTYTALHLIERAKNKEAVYNTLLEHIRNLNNRIIIMDALLDEYIIKWFYHQKRKILYIENKYKKHKDISIFNYGNKLGIFIEDILNNLKDNKKIIIPTNSKNFLNTLEKQIKNNLPNKKCKFLNADNSDDINLDNWNEYDIVGYTPTIVAGISYEENHFNNVFGYFVNSSSCAEMSLQQLFRVRNLKDKVINLCIENKDNSNYLTKIEDIEKYIIDRNSCLVDGAINVKISRINREILRDSYYFLYRDCQIKILKSKNDYEKALLELLRSQGITEIKNIDKIDMDKDKKARTDMRNTSKLFNEDNIKDIINTEDISDDNYNILKNKINLTYNDKNILKKKKFRKTYGYEGDITIDMYKKYCKKYEQYKNLNTCYTLKNEVIKYLEDKIQDIEDQKIEKYNQVTEGKENEFGNKLLSANPFVLHQSKKHEKFVIGLEIFKILGADNIFNKKTFNIDFKKILNYIKEKEYIIRLLFNCRKFDANIVNEDNKSNNEILKYINARLRTLFNIHIKKINKNSNEYSIDNMDYWSEEINPFRENEDLRYEMYIKAMLNNLEINGSY